jgi:hypothetical protein
MLSVVLAALLAAPPVNLGSAPAKGSVEGTVTLAGRPLSGVLISLINLTSGDVLKAKTGSGGAYRVDALPGDYIVTSDGRGGFAVGRAPTRLTVASGRAALADVDLVALPVAAPVRVARLSPQQPDPLQGQVPPLPDAPPQEPPAGGLEQQPPPPNIITIPPTEGGVGITHEAIGCFVAGEFPLVDAIFTPPESVARARVYFKSGLSDEWYFVEMAPEPPGFAGKLPRPRLEASPITYYVQATSTDFNDAQTPELTGIVVEKASDCPDRKVAAIGPPGNVQVFSAATGLSVTAAGFAAGGVALTAGIIALVIGAAAVGVGTVITNPTPRPTPTPTPTPPFPTPTPTESPRPTPTPTPTPPLPSPGPITPLR